MQDNFTYGSVIDNDEALKGKLGLIRLVIRASVTVCAG